MRELTALAKQAVLGIEPRTPSTLEQNHTTRANSRSSNQDCDRSRHPVLGVQHRSCLRRNFASAAIRTRVLSTAIRPSTTSTESYGGDHAPGLLIWNIQDRQDF